jgi:hypothetical protein
MLCLPSGEVEAAVRERQALKHRQDLKETIEEARQREAGEVALALVFVLCS